MQVDLETKLYEAAARTFEEVCFLFAAREPAVIEAEDTGSVAVRIEFYGVFEGAMDLRCPRSMLGDLAGNMLGDAQASQQQQLDAIGELSNVIVGNLLPEIAGKTNVFDVGTPAALSRPEPCRWSKAAAVRLRTDDGPLDLALYIDGFGGEVSS